MSREAEMSNGKTTQHITRGFVFDHKITIGLVVAVVGAMLANAASGVWFAATLTHDVEVLKRENAERKDEINSHAARDAHTDAGNRLSRLEAGIETMAEQAKETNRLLSRFLFEGRNPPGR